MRAPRTAFFALLALVASTATAAQRHPIAEDVAGQLPNAEGPFVMVVELEVPAGGADALVAAMVDPTRETLKEPGNAAYALSQNVKEPTKFVLYEHWKSVDALDAHLKQPYLKKLLAAFEKVLAAPPTVTVLNPIAFD